MVIPGGPHGARASSQGSRRTGPHSSPTRQPGSLSRAGEDTVRQSYLKVTFEPDQPVGRRMLSRDLQGLLGQFPMTDGAKTEAGACLGERLVLVTYKSVFSSGVQIISEFRQWRGTARNQRGLRSEGWRGTQEASRKPETGAPPTFRPPQRSLPPPAPTIFLSKKSESCDQMGTKPGFVGPTAYVILGGWGTGSFSRKTIQNHRRQTVHSGEFLVPALSGTLRIIWWPDNHDD